MPLGLEEYWYRVHRWPAFFRVLLKVSVFALVLAFVLYPRFWLLPSEIRRLSDMNSVIDPAYPGLAKLEEAVNESVGSNPTSARLLPAVEKAVYAAIPYEYDWNTWGVIDYLPTVQQAFEKGKEDCDGQAVVAASLLRRMGTPAWLVSDVLHTWVATPYGEIMNPGSPEKTLKSDESGTHITINLATVNNLGRGLSFGVGVFPFNRELVILAALVALSAHPLITKQRFWAGVLFLFGSLLLMRFADRIGEAWPPAGTVMGTIGLAGAAAGWVVLLLKGGQSHPGSSSEPPKSNGPDEAVRG